MEEHISFETAEKCNKLAPRYAGYCHKGTKKVWIYPENCNGGHASAPFIETRDDMYFDADDFEEIWSAFDWNELYELMNAVVDGDFRKSEFEAIESIDEFALELNQYLEEKFERDLINGVYCV